MSRADPRTPRARGLRREATPFERKLWCKLREIEWPGGGHFRRQAPVGRYYADFAHHGLKLIVELDGGQHSTDDGVRRDDVRTAILEAAGYRVMRFWNAETVDNLDGVVETILARAAESPPTPVRASRDSALPTASGGRVGALVAVAGLFLAALPALAAEQRPVGSWVLKSGTGNIGSYCTVEAAQGGRTLGLQVVKAGRAFFGLRNPDWSWTPRSTHDARLTVEGGAAWQGKAVAPLPDTLVLPVEPIRGRDPAKVLEGARSLVFEVEGTSMRFDLTDFPNAARAQRDCLSAPS